MNAPPADPPFLSVAVPAYNEEANLEPTVRTLLDHLGRSVPSFEILIVDDASRDGTADVARQLTASDPRVRVFRHPENRGIGGGFRTAVHEARGEWFLLVPADLALDPRELTKYFEAARDSDVVVGLRSDRSDYGVFRRLVSWVNVTLIRTLFRMRERQFQYISLYRTSVLREVGIEYWRSAFFLPEILIKARARGARLREVTIRYVPREAGRATGASFRMIRRTVRDMLAFWLRGDWRPR